MTHSECRAITLAMRVLQAVIEDQYGNVGRFESLEFWELLHRELSEERRGIGNDIGFSHPLMGLMHGALAVSALTVAQGAEMWRPDRAAEWQEAAYRRDVLREWIRSDAVEYAKSREEGEE